MFLKIISDRRSIRKYKKKKNETEKIDLFLKAALRAPSSRSIYPSEFIVITDELVLEKLSKSKKHGADFLKNIKSRRSKGRNFEERHTEIIKKILWKIHT